MTAPYGARAREVSVAEAASPLSVRWLGHSTLTIDLAGVRILTDPVLRASPGMLSRVGRRPAEADWAGVSAVLLSHLHLDHADVPSLRRLAVPVATTPDNAPWLAKVGRAPLTVDDRGWHPVPGPGGPDSGVEVRLVRAVHRSRPMPHRPNGATGFLLRSADRVVWFAGDTDLYAGIEEVAEAAGRPIDLALVPIGGWGPRLSPGHMGPREAAEACRRVEARHAFAIHHNTFHPVGWPRKKLGWMHAPEHAFATAMAEVAEATTHVRAPVGEAFAVPAAR